MRVIAHIGKERLMNYEQIKKVFLFFGRAFTREVLRFWQSKFLSNLGRSKERERKQQKEKRAVREREREREWEDFRKLFPEPY